MVTGDAPATAAIVAKAVGLNGAICPRGPIPDTVHPDQFAVFAGVLPEEKYKLVKAFQKGGHTVGMCGDGANDAPALRQAQMGIAVSTATDVAKSAAGMVLTRPGLTGIVAAVKEGRMTFQRILSYTLNSITAILLIFQAMDAAGKDGAIKHVMSGSIRRAARCSASSIPAPRTAARLPLAHHARSAGTRAGSASSTAPITRKC
jgi:cation transport ATPase